MTRFNQWVKRNAKFVLHKGEKRCIEHVHFHPTPIPNFFELHFKLTGIPDICRDGVNMGELRRRYNNYVTSKEKR